MKVSVIIPCHGAAVWLGAQLEALAEQDWDGEWEVILADNGMAPHALGIIEHFRERLPGLRRVEAPNARGGAHARNQGAAAATGESLLFVDSDDVVADGWLGAMAEALNVHELCASRFEYALLNPQDEQAGLHYAQESGLQKLWYPPWIEHAGGCGLGVRKSIHQAAGGFDETLQRLEDTDFCIRLALAGVTVRFVRQAVVHIRLRDTTRGRMRQARYWAMGNCLLYSRYGREGLAAAHAWRVYGVDWLCLARRSLHIRSRASLQRWSARLGRQIGLAEGFIRYRVPPPVMPHERPLVANASVPDGSGASLAKTGRTRRFLRGRMGTLVSVRTDRRVAALTFDDGPDPVFTPRLLEVLEAHGARATFFLIGERAERHPEIVRAIAAAGHAIGNHTYSHRPLPGLSSADQAAELQRCRQNLGETATRLFRPPYGQQDEQSYRAARRAGCDIVGWSLLSGDWRYQRSDQLAAAIIEQLAPGAIILMHDSLHEPRDPSAADRTYAIEAVDEVLSRVGGYMRFVTVPELLEGGKAVRRAWFTRGRPRPEGPDRVLPPHDAAPAVVEGQLRLGVFGPGESVEPEAFTSEWARGTNYDGMSDCDIRGFLDGAFRWAWNQPSQVHVRVGRLGWTLRPDRAPVMGERELFRCLQRWESLVLPQPAEVLETTLTLEVEKGAPRALDICLYEAFRDWNPGRGGIDLNNVSVPAPGEVWWNEAEADSKAWAKPGLGAPGSVSGHADTAMQPLATCRYEPGNSTVALSSPDLARYIERRLRSEQPLLFLIKLSDVDEDREGSVLTFWSAENGDERNEATRPRLSVTWKSRSQVGSAKMNIRLEQGRSLELPELASGPDRRVVAEWTGRERGWSPQVQWRHSQAEGAWSRLGTCNAYSDGTSLRLLAAQDPVMLGGHFRTGLQDTWVISGPPDEQVVEWWFISPSGALKRLESTYRGGYRWDVEFQPGEVGSWRYYWNHRLSGDFVRGPVGRFDVLGGEMAAVLSHLDSLAGEVAEGRERAEPADLRSWAQRLMSLERAAVALVSPEAWSHGCDSGIREHVNRVRASLWGRPVPETLPRLSHALVAESDGRPLFDPYPAFRGSGRASSWRRGVRRLKRRLARLVR